MNIFNAIMGIFTPKEIVQDDYGAIASYLDAIKNGNNINEDKALTINAVWACTKLISETISTLPIHIYKKTADGREKDDTHPLNYILKTKPNSESTSALFWQSFVASMLLRGNGISKKLKIGNKLVGLQFMPYNKLNIRLDSNQKAIISEILPQGGLKPLNEEDIFRVANFSLDGRWGKSVISVGAGDFSNSLNMSKSSNNMMEKGLLQTIAFKTDKRIPEDQREKFKEALEDYSGAMNSGKSILLEQDMDAKVLSINPKDAQLLESKSFSVEEVCRWFLVDPSLIGHGKAVSNWGTGLEQKMIAFLSFALAPILRKIEQAINAELIQDNRYFVEFAIEGLLRADSGARSTYYREMVNAGIMTRDEVRRLENLPPKGGNASELMINMASQQIDEVGAKFEKN